MNGVLSFLVNYIILILIWTIINLVLFASSYLFKKNFSYLALALSFLVNFGIQLFLIIYPFYIIWQIIVAKQWLLLILAFIFSGFIISFWQMIYDFLLTPFSLITLFFTTKAQELIEKPKEEFEAEYISPEGKVIGKTESEDLVNKKLTAYFLLAYFLNLLSIFFSNKESLDYKWGDYIVMPFVWLILPIFVFGLIIILINKIKHGAFFYNGIKNLLIKIFKITSIIYIVLYVIYFITGVWRI